MNNKLQIKTLLIVLCLFSFPFAASEPGQGGAEVSDDGVFKLPDGGQLSGVATLKGKLPKGVLSIAGVTLGSAGTASCSRSDASPAVWLAFEAGTPENPCSTLTAFTISSDSSRQSDTTCPRSPLLSIKAATQNGLSLGMPQAQVLKKIGGKPSKVTPQYVVYFFENFRAYTPAEKAKIKAETDSDARGEWSYQTLIARFKDGKMDYLRVSASVEVEN